MWVLTDKMDIINSNHVVRFKMVKVDGRCKLFAETSIATEILVKDLCGGAVADYLDCEQCHEKIAGNWLVDFYTNLKADS